MRPVIGTITIQGTPVFGGQVTFAVDAKVKKDSDLYLLWVANKVFQGGELVSAEYQPVQNGQAGPFTLGPSDAWTGGDAQAEAYVWMFPASEKPVSGITPLFYTITG